MIRLPDIHKPASDILQSDLVRVVETITLTGNDSGPVALIAQSMGDSGPSIILGLIMLLVILLVLRKTLRKARAQSRMPQETGVSFAASVEIPPYVDTSNIASIAAKIDPAEAIARLSDTWMGARQKVEANPLYSPNSYECMARDAVEIERIFCGGHLAKHLSKQPAEAFDRFAHTARTLGSLPVANLIEKAKRLAAKGHSQAMKNEPRKGEAWHTFRKEIARLEAEIRDANSVSGNAGRIVTLADAFMSQSTASAA